MVNYLPSQATRSITVIPPDVATSLTISAPASVVQGRSFNISGILIRNDTGTAIPNEVIAILYNGSPIGSTTTGIDGDYLMTGSIPIVGNFTLKANFAGAERSGLILGPSSASRGLGVSLLQVPVVGIIASTVLGIVLVMLGCTK